MPIGPRPGFACIAAGDTPRSRGFEHAAARAARAPIAQRRTPAGAVQPHSDQRDRAHDHGTEHGTDAKLKPCAERGPAFALGVREGLGGDGGRRRGVGWGASAAGLGRVLGGRG